MEDKGVSRNTKVFGIASFLTDLSSEMLVPIVPIFLTVFLGAGAFVVGLMEGLSEITVAVFKYISGRMADVRKKKPLVMGGYGLSALMKVIFAFVATWQQFLVAKVVERAGKGIRDVPRDVLIGFSEDRKHVGRAYGFRKMLDSAGAILGPLVLAGMLVLMEGWEPGEMYRTIFLVAVVPAFLAVLVLFFVHEKKAPEERKERWDGLSPKFKSFLYVAAVFSIGQIGISFFILRANELLTLIMVPIAYIAYNAAYTAAALPAGMLADKFGPRKMLALAYLLFAAGCAAFAFASGMAAVLVLFALLGIFMAIMKTGPRTFVVDTVVPSRFGSAIGTYEGLTGMLFLPANLFAGLLWETYVLGAHLPLLISAVIGLGAAFAMAFLVKD